MRDATELARLLCQGWLDLDETPELDEVGVRQDVGGRLEAVGHRLARTSGGWVAVAEAPITVAAVDARDGLDASARCALALLYLWLVLVPLEQDTDPFDGAGVSYDTVIDTLEGRGWRKGVAEGAVAAVCAAGWARRLNRRLGPSPALVALDRPELREPIAERVMRHHLDRFLSA